MSYRTVETDVMALQLRILVTEHTVPKREFSLGNARRGLEHVEAKKQSSNHTRRHRRTLVVVVVVLGKAGSEKPRSDLTLNTRPTIWRAPQTQVIDKQ